VSKKVNGLYGYSMVLSGRTAAAAAKPLLLLRKTACAHPRAPLQNSANPKGEKVKPSTRIVLPESASQAERELAEIMRQVAAVLIRHDLKESERAQQIADLWQDGAAVLEDWSCT
jgi:hypothetical protein